MIKLSESSAAGVIEAAGLVKRFGNTPALQGIDLSVAEGTVCGLLGPNGAGKTTAVRILTTLIRPDAGTAVVAGYDVVRNPSEVRYRIGLAGQYAAVDEKLSGRDNLRLFGRLYHLSDRAARRRADELLEQFGLVEAASRRAGTYSGGMRRRLDVIASLIVAPRVLFLDEPTTGLDPLSRSEIWASVRQLARGGTTVLLTTQYMDEADHLSDQITVIDHGRVIASDTPDKLKAVIGDRLDVVVHDDEALPLAAEALARIARSEPQITPERRLASVPVHGGSLALVEVVHELDRAGIGVEDVALRRPTLDEVFVNLVGAGAGTAEAPPADGPAPTAGAGAPGSGVAGDQAGAGPGLTAVGRGQDLERGAA
jgi:ABC-2 type transport system ATP-binding protein